MQRVVGPLCNVTGDARADNTHNRSDDTFSQPSMAPLLTCAGINNYLARSHSAREKRQNRCEIQRASIRCELCLNVFCDSLFKYFCAIKPLKSFDTN